MKKSVSLKLIVFSFLLVVNDITFSVPEIKAGTAPNSIVAGEGNEASEEESLAFGFMNKASGKKSLAFGHKNEASEEESLAFGFMNKASGKKSLVFGYKNEASEEESSAFGFHNKAIGKKSSAFGDKNEASGFESSVLGGEYKVTGSHSGAFGRGTYDERNHKHLFLNEGGNSYMIGNGNSIASGSNDNFILGNNVNIGVDSNGRPIISSVVLGHGSSATESEVVSVGSSDYRRRIVNIRDGRINATSGDAVTGKQLYEIAKATSTDIDVNAWKAKLGVGSGGVDLTAYSKRDASNLTATDISAWRTKLGVGAGGGGGGGVVNTATGIGSTGLGIDNTVTGNNSTAVGYKNKVTGNKSGAFGDPNVVTGNGSYAFGNDNTINGDNNFVLGNNVTIGSGIQNSVALGNNSTVSSSNEVSVGSKGKERKITNVADGDISATSTDAVNGRQLYKAMQNSSAAGIENLRNEVNEKIDNVKDEINHVGSLSAALAGLHPMQYDSKAPMQVMAALGHYRNKQSVAVGLSYYFNDRFMMGAGVAIGGERRVKSMANVGFTLKLGKGSGVIYQETPQYIVQNEVKRLTVENQNLKSQVNNQGRENQELKAEINSLNTKNKEQDAKIKNLEEKLNKLLKSK
ncbi:YadA-like C-terminal domain protein [Fusobacterium sp. CM21]|uniref:YadA family autotransporter adhesin n=1 Tax=Fusobacterium vincentii TaxID=155615 RepID=A0AAJ1CUJ3_FUSVC|nr:MULTISPECIES: YadA family autotransporter adhesin [Fusobacterium]ETS97249.1 YadA-like C-terminal domain protein [Fusobacterium sp. CM21]MCW0264478.1 YadA family autotransporter adhesin [Fusobacterium vincentii]MDH2315858.1 YadA family autotransporter adhesin [Fusobacterium nucleatum]OHU81061.1 cell surface protein [Fusobacterium nucleatum]STO29453.1 Hep_Hag [Fusobacterium vincentii]